MNTKTQPVLPMVKETDFFLPNLCNVKAIFLLAITAQLIACVLILATGDILSESWDELGLLSVFVQWIVLTSGGALCLSRRPLAKLSVMWASVMSYLIVVVTTAIISACAQYLMIKINYQWGNRPETIGEFVFRCVSISAIFTFVALRYFYIVQQWKQRIELESQARVDALQARIRPHFLFNSMNIIASLIQTEPRLAEQAVEDLAEIFRATLKDKGSMVPLSEEWILCRNYLRIEGLRLGERLTLEANLSGVPQDAAIPMLTLQPLMENAIYHGIQSLEKGGTIKVVGAMEGNLVCITISNPVPPISQKSPSQGNKMAMANIRHRLNLLFGSHAELTVNVTPEQYEVKV
ncbi:MAG: sensor histidine kinase, partial [Candidatus Berkiellales bacterium]